MKQSFQIVYHQSYTFTFVGEALREYCRVKKDENLTRVRLVKEEKPRVYKHYIPSLVQNLHDVKYGVPLDLII